MSDGKSPPAPPLPRVALDPADCLLAPAFARSAPPDAGCSIFGITGPFTTPGGTDGTRLSPVLAHPAMLLQLSACATDGTMATMTLRGTPRLLALCGPRVPGRGTPTIVFGGVREAADLAAAQIAGDWAQDSMSDRAPLAVTWSVVRLTGDQIDGLSLNVLTPSDGTRMQREDRQACAAALLESTHAASPAPLADSQPLESADEATRVLLDGATVAAGIDGAMGPMTVFSGPGGTGLVQELDGAMHVRRSRLGLVATVHMLLSESDAEVLTLLCANEDRLLAEWSRERGSLDWTPAARARALAERLLAHGNGGGARFEHLHRAGRKTARSRPPHRKLTLTGVSSPARPGAARAPGRSREAALRRPQ